MFARSKKPVVRHVKAPDPAYIGVENYLAHDGSTIGISDPSGYRRMHASSGRQLRYRGSRHGIMTTEEFQRFDCTVTRDYIWLFVTLFHTPTHIFTQLTDLVSTAYPGLLNCKVNCATLLLGIGGVLISLSRAMSP